MSAEPEHRSPLRQWQVLRPTGPGEVLHLREQNEGGRIICIGSPTGQRGNFGQTNYAAAKAGIVGMVRTWALELKRAGITANAVIPVAATAMTATVPYYHGADHGGTLSNPWALAIDGSGNVWTLKPGCVTASAIPCTPTGMALYQLVGAAAPTVTPLSQQVNNATGTRPVR